MYSFLDVGLKHMFINSSTAPSKQLETRDSTNPSSETALRGRQANHMTLHCQGRLPQLLPNPRLPFG